MGPESKDSSKSMDWKSVEEPVSTGSSSDGAPVKKRLPKKIRHIPDYYFLPRMSLPSAILFYGSCIAAGIGAGMLTEMWLEKKAKEDAGVVSESHK
ncbi:Dihydrosphingosine phosphate lyase [Orobanche minor]